MFAWSRLEPRVILGAVDRILAARSKKEAEASSGQAATERQPSRDERRSTDGA